MYSEQDLRYAAEFREGVHREALALVRREYPNADRVVDRWGVEDYFQRHWDYPGKWYTVVAIPKDFHSRAALIDAIAADTLAALRRTGETREGRAPSQTRRESGGACPDDPFYALLAEYPDCVAEYRIVTGAPSHRAALDAACRSLMASDGWRYDTARATCRRVAAETLFAPCRGDALTYRGAFLHPPHENSYTDADFDRLNAALFPLGTEDLEVREWTTDWSDYFDEGHEWWGALCLSVYDKKMRRYAVILASATD